MSEPITQDKNRLSTAERLIYYPFLAGACFVFPLWMNVAGASEARIFGVGLFLLFAVFLWPVGLFYVYGSLTGKKVV